MTDEDGFEPFTSEQVDEPAVAERVRPPWMSEQDEKYFEEDSERNVEQAGRNASMRDRLRQVREEKRATVTSDTPVLPEEFMGCAAVAPSGRIAVDENQPPWFVMRPHVENVALRLHEELLDFMDFMKPTKFEVETRRNWVRTIAKAAKTLWPKCEVRIFGSFFTGLTLPNGDVDVSVLNCPCKPATGMKMLVDHMLELGEISWLEIIESAKVPVAKIRSQTCGLRADLVFNQPDGIETSKFIKEQLRLYPQMRPMLIFLKYFLLQRGLHETFTGGMGSYLCCSVVLHFLQRHQSRLDQRVYSATSLGHYLFDFFKYYGQEFKYDSEAISVTDGGSVFNPSERGWGPRKGKSKGKGKEKGKKGGGLSLHLESPLQRGVDLGGACFRMAVLRNLFHHGFHCICHLFVTRAPAEASLLSPLLLDPAHPVITNRHALLNEQPVALVGLQSATERAAAAAEADAEENNAADDAALGLDADSEAPEENVAKRRRTHDA